MLDSKGFDLQADNYDKSVGVSDEDGIYPFAGYKIILNEIYNRVLNSFAKTVLDIGFGTGTLTTKLYEQGCIIYGQDFSDRMIEIAQEKMPTAKLFQGDFSNGLERPLLLNKYDAIITTYSLHHLTDTQNVNFIKSLLMLLNDRGCLYIGDVAFDTRTSLQKCKEEVGYEWDDDEIYFVIDELKLHFPTMNFHKIFNCSGIISLQRQIFKIIIV